MLSLTGRGTGPCCEPPDVAFCVMCLSKTCYTILKIVDWDVKYQPNQTILLNLAGAFPARTNEELVSCADPESFAIEGSNSDGFFVCLFFMRGERIQIALKAGHHRLASETPLSETQF